MFLVVLQITRAIARYLMLPIGVLLLLASGYTYRSNASWAAQAAKAEAIVTALIESRSDSGSVTYAPKLKFKSADSREHEIVATLSSNPPPASVGQTVTVLYDPANPESVMIDGLLGVWAVPTILAGTGGLVLLVSLVLLYISRGVVERTSAA